MRHETSPEATDTADIVRRLWSESFGTSDWAPQDDFFASGGTSLQGVKLTAAIGVAVGRRLRFKVLAQNPTLGELIGAVQHEVDGLAAPGAG